MAEGASLTQFSDMGRFCCAARAVMAHECETQERLSVARQCKRGRAQATSRILLVRRIRGWRRKILSSGSPKTNTLMRPAKKTASLKFPHSGLARQWAVSEAQLHRLIRNFAQPELSAHSPAYTHHACLISDSPSRRIRSAHRREFSKFARFSSSRALIACDSSRWPCL
jgi:hypothetical protein